MCIWLSTVGAGMAAWPWFWGKAVQFFLRLKGGQGNLSRGGLFYITGGHLACLGWESSRHLRVMVLGVGGCF